MKKHTLLYIGTFLMMVCSCSNIAEEDRLIYVEPEISGDRAVLIEDFTGQKCVNCPNATDAIKKMQEAYGEDNVIAVAIHSGPFGVDKATKAYPIALKTEFTQQYWDKWFDDTQGQPVAKINRGEKTEEYGNWSALVSEELKKTATVEIKLEGSYDETNRTITLSSNIVSKEAATVKYQLWVVEDSIVATQKMPDGTTNKEYVHNHILRDAVNGAWGEDISLKQNEVKLTHEYTIPEEYKAENCSIVAFVYNDEGGVIQVTKCPVRVKD